MPSLGLPSALADRGKRGLLGPLGRQPEPGPPPSTLVFLGPPPSLCPRSTEGGRRWSPALPLPTPAVNLLSGTKTRSFVTAVGSFPCPASHPCLPSSPLLLSVLFPTCSRATFPPFLFPPSLPPSSLFLSFSLDPFVVSSTLCDPLRFLMLTGVFKLPFQVKIIYRLCVCMCVCACVCTHVCACTCPRACAWTPGCVRAERSLGVLASLGA